MISSTKLQQNFIHAHLELDINKVLFALDDKGVLQYEAWKDIPNYEGCYKCSNFGRVKSLERYVPRGNHQQYKPEIILKQNFNKGYLYVGLKKYPINKKVQVHQLVAICFLSHIPCKFEIVIDHKNNIPTSNFEWNLQLITNRANVVKDTIGKTSKLTGVSFNTRAEKWRALIYFKGKNTHLGFFDDENEASDYYQNALKAIENGTEIIIKRRKQASSRVGICKSANKWSANHKGKYLGVFDTEQQAIDALKNYRKENNIIK